MFIIVITIIIIIIIIIITIIMIIIIIVANFVNMIASWVSQLLVRWPYSRSPVVVPRHSGSPPYCFWYANNNNIIIIIIIINNQSDMSERTLVKNGAHEDDSTSYNKSGNHKR